MRYAVRVGGREFEVEVRGNEVTVNGKSYRVDLQRVGEGRQYSLLLGPRSYNIIVEEDKGELRVFLLGELYKVRLHEGRKPPVEPEIAVREEAVVRAPMPGLVVNVPVKEGDEVNKGDVVVVLEAMKMENELLSPTRGRVQKVHVRVGDVVSQDQNLVVIG